MSGNTMATFKVTTHLRKGYNKFVKQWYKDHKGIEFKGTQPPSFFEWYYNDRELK